jgi:hypothetical protein
MNKKLLLEKYIKVAVRKALAEQEAKEKKATKAMYLIYRFPGLKKTIEELMSPSFGRYISSVSVIAPKPTTFKIDLINGQDFTIYYAGSGNYTAKIAGKKYHPDNVGESERASQAIVNLLELNYAPKEEIQQSSKGASSPTKNAELAADISSASEPPSPETAAPEIPSPEVPSPEEEVPQI